MLSFWPRRDLAHSVASHEVFDDEYPFVAKLDPWDKADGGAIYVGAERLFSSFFPFFLFPLASFFGARPVS